MHSGSDSILATVNFLPFTDRQSLAKLLTSPTSTLPQPAMALPSTGKHKQLTVISPNTTDPHPTIPFNQSNLFHQLNSKQHSTLYRIHRKFNGLCDVICNLVLAEDMLGNSLASNDFLYKAITVEKLQAKPIRHSHVTRVYSLWQRILIIFFHVFPDNALPRSEQKMLVSRKTRSINRMILRNSLSRIDVGASIKLTIFRIFPNTSGHCVLIKKESPDSYIFFDPNWGEYRALPFDQLSDLIDAQIRQFGSNVFISKSEDVLRRILPT